jgi:hypothetical protein
MLEQKGLGWVRLRTLFFISQCGSLYSAAPALGLGGVRAVRKRIITLEEGLNLVLLRSESNTCYLTPDARAVIDLIRPEFEGKGSTVA